MERRLGGSDVPQRAGAHTHTPRSPPLPSAQPLTRLRSPCPPTVGALSGGAACLPNMVGSEDLLRPRPSGAVPDPWRP